MDEELQQFRSEIFLPLPTTSISTDDGQTEKIDLVVENNRQNLEKLNQTVSNQIKTNNESQIMILSKTLNKFFENMGKSLVEAIQDGFKMCSEDLKRNGVEKQGPSTSNSSKSKRKVGPASLPVNKRPKSNVEQ